LPSTEASDTDVLIPKAGILVDELLHQPDAFLILEHFDRNAPRTEKFLLAEKCPILPDDDTGNPI
jgi:hypothetical protein